MRPLRRLLLSIDKCYLICAISPLETYRISGYPNLYVNIPDPPADVFGSEAAQYVGGAIFSRDSSWTIWIKAPGRSEERLGPEIQVHLMDGDGHTKSGSGVGLVTVWYNFDQDSLKIRATGTGGTPRSPSPKHRLLNLWPVYLRSWRESTPRIRVSGVRRVAPSRSTQRSSLLGPVRFHSPRVVHGLVFCHVKGRAAERQDVRPLKETGWSD